MNSLLQGIHILIEPSGRQAVGSKRLALSIGVNILPPSSLINTAASFRYEKSSRRVGGKWSVIRSKLLQ